MKKKKGFWLASLLLVGTLLGCSAGQSGQSAGTGAKEIRIGVLTSESGPSALLGAMNKKGLELALEEVGNNINGTKVVVISTNDDSKAEVSLANVKRLISEENVHVVFGPAASTPASSTQQETEKQKVAQIGGIPAASKLTDNHPYYFRAGAIADRWQMKALAEFVKGQGWKKVAYLHDSNAYGTGLYTDLSNYLKDVVTETNKEQYKPGDKDMKSQLLKIKEQNPDAIAILGTAVEAGAAAAQARELGLTQPIIGGSGLAMPNYIEIAKSGAENTYLTAAFVNTDPRPEAKAFVEAWKKKFNELPDTHAAQSYDAAKMLIAALQKAQLGLTNDSLAKDREAIKEALTQLKDFKGICAVQSFGPEATPEDRDANKNPIIVQVKNGTYLPIQ
ncbi:ABC transporter substrate-binding protein [Brevibacillus sp. H7]|jgi:branched-chain amino acid transport system substrate-binding protein|uniref:ABC transporter substrate-binding protein n=1 Tax=Brevibacillus sp. H7 TaxID=3349138 RepID=UPI0037F3E08B